MTRIRAIFAARSWKHWRLVPLALVVIMSFSSSGTASVAAQTDSRTFAETGKTLTGDFLRYWNERGGLLQFGYPISNQMSEQSDTDGKSYTVQYFERSVFELHPENAPPNDVLLSLLGNFVYQQKYPSGAPNQTPNLSPGSALFSETGKRVGGVFLNYWNEHGALAQQGFPISDEFSESSPLDGKTYKVQYFERAVLELHTENKSPNDVLLSQLGRFYYESRHNSSPQSTVTVPSAITQLLSGTLTGSPAAGGHYIFWTDERNPQMAIYGYDLNTSQEFLVKNLSLGATSLATDGQTLVWVEGEPQAGDSIHSYDLTTNRESTVVSNGTDEYDSLALEEGILYYAKGGTGLVARSLSTGREQLISATGSRPVVADGKVLWVELRQLCPPDDICYSNWDLYLATLTNVKDKLLLASSGPNGFTRYTASGDHVVWADAAWLNGFALFDTKSGTKRIIQSQGISDPIIQGDTIVWSEGPSGWTIKGYDLATGSSWTIIPETNDLATPFDILGGQRLLFSVDGRLYLASLGK